MRIQKNIRYNIDNHHHGLFIKEARLRTNYRVVALTEGICSPSYLSKIEAGLAIPSPAIFEKLASRLGIKFPVGECAGLIKTFRQLIYNNQTSKIPSYLAGNSLHDYEQQLGYFFYAVIVNDHDQAKRRQQLIDQFANHLNDEETQFYKLFLGIHAFARLEWENGKKHFKCALDLMFQLDFVDPYLYFQFAKYYFLTQNTSLGFTFLQRTIDEFKNLYAKEWVFRCSVMKTREYIKNNELQNAKSELVVLENMIFGNRDTPEYRDILNLQGLLYERFAQRQQAGLCLESCIKVPTGISNQDYQIDVVKFYYHSGQIIKLLKLIERIDVNLLTESNRFLVDFYYLKATAVKPDELELFLRKDALPYAIKAMNARDVALYTKELTSLCRQTSRHKKAVDAYYKWEKFREGIEQYGMI